MTMKQKKSFKGKNVKFVGVYIEPELRRKLRLEAAKRDTSISAVLREAIRREVCNGASC